jgi:hypothetical protein
MWTFAQPNPPDYRVVASGGDDGVPPEGAGPAVAMTI